MRISCWVCIAITWVFFVLFSRFAGFSGGFGILVVVSFCCILLFLLNSQFDVNYPWYPLLCLSINLITVLGSWWVNYLVNLLFLCLRYLSIGIFRCGLFNLCNFSGFFLIYFQFWKIAVLPSNILYVSQYWTSNNGMFVNIGTNR